MIRSAFFGSAAGYTPGTEPPGAAPTGVQLTLFGEGLFAIYWTPGDTGAETEIGFRDDPLGILEPTGYLDKVAAGLSVWNGSGFSNSCYYWVRHRKGGTVSAWVRAEPDFDDCTGEPPA